MSKENEKQCIILMATSIGESKVWRTQSYLEQEEKIWPREGKHILAQYDENSIVVYQAYRPEIAEYAVANQRSKHYRID